jgi:hypothetical protein
MIDLIQEFESKEMVTDQDLVAIVQKCFWYNLSVYQCAIRRSKISNPKSGATFDRFCTNLGMKTRHLEIV